MQVSTLLLMSLPELVKGGANWLGG
jgi:hypothetical protein